MPFSKAKNEQEITIVVTHPMHRGDGYEFDFPKQLPKAAIDAESRLFGLADSERSEERRKALIETVAEMVVRDPRGFADFPTDKELPPSGAPRSLSIRFRDYFDDPSHIELEQILAEAWRAYRAASIPNAYLKSAENHSTASNVLSAATTQA